MSDFRIVSKKQKVDPCCGLYDLYITKEEIAALLSGKKLYSTVSDDEYAITIEMEDKDKCCPWYDMCIYKTATCRVRYPDNGCVLYRWFKELMSKEDNNGIHEA